MKTGRLSRTYLPRATLSILFWAAALIAVPTRAETPPALLQARLIAVSMDEPGQADERLRDLLPLLQRNLRYTSYSLAGQRVFPPHPGATEQLGQGFAMIVEDVQGASLTMRLRHDRRELLQTRLRLHRRRPVIVGPFRNHQNQEFIIVIMSPEDN